MGPGRWSTAKATQEINTCARSDLLELKWTQHAKDQMRERGMVMGDLLHVLKRGFVHDEPREATRPGYWKYLVEATTPNSDGRAVGIVVLASGGCALKIVTVMWRDEQ